MLQWSLQAAFIVVRFVYELKEILIDDIGVKWTDVLEALYKAFCKWSVDGHIQSNEITLHVIIVVIGFVVPLISFALVIIPLIISLTTYR